MKNKNDESGKTLFGIIKMVGAIASVLAVLFVVLRYFFGVLFGDSVVESTIKELSERAITVSSVLISGQTTVPSGSFSPTTARGYPITVHTDGGAFFEMTLYNVPKSVCRGLITRRWNIPTSVYLNGRLNFGQAVACISLNQISFEFSRDLNGNVSNADKPRSSHCQGDSDCSGCEACQNGRCVSGCRAGESCGWTLKGKSVCCSTVNKANSLCCSFVEDGQCCWGRGKCCPKEKPIRLSDGTCTDCYDRHVFAIGEPADLSLCRQLCPNRVSFGADNLCMLPLCTDDQFTDRTGECQNCTATGGYKTSAQECAKCPNRTYKDGWCFSPCPAGTIENSQKQCIPCEAPQKVETSDTTVCSGVCPNREQTEQGCVLKECPAGFIPDTDGNCISCALSQTITTASAEECDQCPNRVYEDGHCLPLCPENTFRDKDGQCVSCANPSAIPVVLNQLECQKCPDRLALNGYCFAACETGQFRDAFGTCHNCSDLGSYPVLQTAICSVCSNRSILLHQLDGQVVPYCMPQYCPLDFFMDKLGGCHDCFGDQAIAGTTQTECEKCPNRQWTHVGNTCRIKPDCGAGEIIDSNGLCHACDSREEAISVEGHPEECIHCPDRYLFGSWCRKCPTEARKLTDKDACQKCGGSWDNRIRVCYGR